MNSGSSSTTQSKNGSQTPSNAIENEVNTRVKRIYTDKSTNENNSKVIDVLSIKIKPKGKKEETKNEEEKNEDMEINSNKNNKYDIFKEINEKNINMFKKKLIELSEIKNEEFKNDECKEFYLVSRNWIFKLRNSMKSESLQRLKELKNNKDNNHPAPCCVDRDFEVLFVELPERLGRPLAVLRHHLVPSDLEHHRDVYLDGVVHRVFHSGDAHPVASGGDAAAGELLRVAAAHEAVHERLVAGVARPALLVLEEKLHRPTEELRVDLVVEAYREVRRYV